MTEEEKKKKGKVMTTDDKIAQGLKLKSEGNEFYKEKKYASAARKYVRIFLYVKGLSQKDPQMQMYAAATSDKLSSDQEDQIVKLQVDANNNLAMCYIKLKNGKKAQHFSSQALELDPKNLKAKCRLAEAYVMQKLKYLEEAERLIVDILSVDETNKKALSLKKKCVKLNRALDNKMKKRFKGAFS